MIRQDGDTTGLFPLMPASRRGFLVTGLASGFALSVRPAGATVVTSADGLTAGEVQIPVSDGQIPAYRAQPATGGPFPVLLVVEEIFGVHEHIQDMCRRFAKHGYLAVAPELYARLGDVVHMTDIDQVIATVNRAPDTRTLADLDATAAWAVSHGGDSSRLGITGWCRGGRTTWMYAAHNPALKAGVAWYGPLSNKPSEAMPTSPLTLAATIKPPVLGLYGGKDQGIPQSDVEAMKAALAATGNKSAFVVYPEAGHGFNADYRPSYDPVAAADAMKRCLDWFAAHGVA
jgi:carboxymethylenebutenolidase